MTTTTEPTAGEAVFIPLNKLKKSPRNARQTAHTEAAIDALAASIRAKGLLQNLVVEPERDADGKETGGYYVTAGEGRRLALLLLAKRRRLKKTAPVRCVVDTANDALEISLDENVTRTPMHPADQFEAFRRLSEEQGWGAEEIAARFGVSAQVVRQRLRLGAVSPRLMQCYRDGELTLEQLMAFAISDDHARQEQVHEMLRESWTRQPHQIRRVMMETHVESDDPRALLVGQAYAKAGGTIVRDLFSEEDGGFLADVELLDRLVVEKLQAVAEEVRTEGWQWVEARLEFPYDHGMRRVYPQQVELSAEDQERLDALSAELDALAERYDGGEELSEAEEARYDELETAVEALVERQRVYDPELMARSGAFVCLGRDGRARIERGFIRPEDEVRTSPEGSSDGGDLPLAGEGDTPAAGSGSITDGSNHEQARTSLPDALVRDLTAHRTLALRLQLGRRPDVALTAITHALAAQLFFHDLGASCLELTATEIPLRGDAPGIDDTPSGRALAERHDSWAARMPEDASHLWAFVADLDEASGMDLLAHCLSMTVFAVRQRWERKPGAQVTANRIVEAVSLDMAAHWQATAESYFGRVTKAQILEAVREAVSELEADRIAGMKKQAMAKAAEEILAGTGWLPALLRTPACRGVSEVQMAEAA